jgi:hypothetical protein
MAEQNGDDDSGKTSALPRDWLTDISDCYHPSKVIRWYAGRLCLDPDDPDQYVQAEKSLKNRVKGDYWRVIALGQPLTEEAGNCEDEYCLVRGIDACTTCRDKELSMDPEPEDSTVKSTAEEISELKALPALQVRPRPKGRPRLSHPEIQRKKASAGSLEWLGIMNRDNE